MGQLTGLLWGTAFDDVFAADVALEVIDPADTEATGAAIAHARIETFNGNDTVIAQITVTSLLDYPTATGIQNSAIALGAGGDRLEVSATANGIFTTAYGVRFSSLRGDDGDDTFTITARSFLPEYRWEASGTAIGLSNTTLDGGNGNNTITIRGLTETTQRWTLYPASGYGLLSGSITVGTGNDIITITGFGQGSGSYQTVSGYGVEQGAIATNGGSDVLIITATAEGVGFANPLAYGLVDGSIRLGEGSDSLDLSANGISRDYYSGFGTSYGVARSIVEGGDGSDRITVSAYATGHMLGGSPENAPKSYSVANSRVSSGEGDDDIILKSETLAGSQRFGGTLGHSYGVWRSSLRGDRGNDTLRIEALTTAGAFAGAGAYAYGIDESSVTGDDGNDLMTVITEAHSSSYLGRWDVGNKSISSGIINSSLNGGDGDDTIQIESKARAVADLLFESEEAIAHGVYKASILGDRGNDTITIAAETTNRYRGAAKGTAHGVQEGRIEGGEGNDSITISGHAFGELTPDTAEYSQYVAIRGYGVVKSSISGGDGDDLISISGTTFAIQDALISGGSGDDRFQVGIGQGTLDGGAGNDRVILDFLDLQTMTVTALGNHSLRITGTQDGQGKDAAWTQTIWNMERFQVSSNVFHTSGDLIHFLQTAG